MHVLPSTREKHTPAKTKRDRVATNLTKWLLIFRYNAGTPAAQNSTRPAERRLISPFKFCLCYTKPVNHAVTLSSDKENDLKLPLLVILLAHLAFQSTVQENI